LFSHIQMQKLRPLKSPNRANSPSFYSSPPITTFDHTQISLLPVPKFQPASGKPRPRAGVLKVRSWRRDLRGLVTAATHVFKPHSRLKNQRPRCLDQRLLKSPVATHCSSPGWENGWNMQNQSIQKDTKRGKRYTVMMDSF
jgi:hypothetical protein